MDVTKEYEKRGFLYWFLIYGISATGGVRGNMAEVPRNLVVTLNGEEIDPIVAFQSLETKFKDAVRDEAKELLRDAQRDILMDFEDSLQELNSKVKNALNSFIDDTVDSLQIG